MTWSCDVCLRCPVTSPTRSTLHALKDFATSVLMPRRQRLLVLNTVKWHCHLSLRRHGGKFRDRLQTALPWRVETVACIQAPKRDPKAVFVLCGFTFVFGVEGGGRGGLVTSPVNMVTEYILKVSSTFWNTCRRTWLLPVRNNSVKHGSTNTFTRNSCWKTM